MREVFSQVKEYEEQMLCNVMLPDVSKYARTLSLESHLLSDIFWLPQLAALVQTDYPSTILLITHHVVWGSPRSSPVLGRSMKARCLQTMRIFLWIEPLCICSNICGLRSKVLLARN